MVKSGHGAPPVPIEFENTSQARFEVESLRASTLIRRESPKRLHSFQRLGFHLIALYTAGETTHLVDFEPHRCRRGTVISVQPGQVQRWLLRPGAEALVVVFTPSFIFPAGARSPFAERFFEELGWPALLRLAGDDYRVIEGWFRRIEQTYRRIEPGPLGAELMRHLVSVLLYELTRYRKQSPAPRTVELPEVVARARRFRADLERSFKVTRTVGDYSHHLGCSDKTLDRACRAILGAPAKELIDDRVALEARRLLAHTTMTVAAIGEHLGFSEPTNFSKFFKGCVGKLPGEFRELARR
jgi:AraC-like DNA-binding protein